MQRESWCRGAAELLGWSQKRVATEARIPVLLEPSVKKALDLEWSAPDAKATAINTLVQQLDALDAWLRDKLPQAIIKEPPLKKHLDTLAQIREQRPRTGSRGWRTRANPPGRRTRPARVYRGPRGC